MEEKDAIVSTLSQLSIRKKGMNSIRDSQKYKALSKRLGVLDEVEGVEDSSSIINLMIMS